MVVLVTGARVKIGGETSPGCCVCQRVARITYIAVVVDTGYQIGLKLLRCGAELVATSRFPRNTADRYACEPDFDAWAHRLHVYGIDLRVIGDIDALVHLIETR